MSCRKCGFCCKVQIYPLPHNTEFDMDGMVEIYYRKGRKLFQDPDTKEWCSISFNDSCQWLSNNRCDIYEHSKRPRLCKTWCCDSDINLYTYYESLVNLATEALKQKYGEI